MGLEERLKTKRERDGLDNARHGMLRKERVIISR